MIARKFDICECGDYRHQHDGRDGHGNCRSCHWDCRQFRINQQMIPTWVAAR